MDRKSASELGGYFFRDGEKIEIIKIPDRIALRLKRGKRQEDVSSHYDVSHGRSFHRQKIEEFNVNASERDAIMSQIRQGSEVEFASHVYAMSSEPEEKFVFTNEITVQFKPTTSNRDIENIVLKFGLNLVKKIAALSNTFVFSVTAQATENPVKLSNRLLGEDEVLLAEPNIVIAIRKNYRPTDAHFQFQWHLHNDGGPFLSPDAHVDAVRAWDIERGERNIVVAILDDSIDINHIDFQGDGKTVAAVDFVGRDFQPLPEQSDDNHGTACAGVAVAEENGNGVVGIAPGCALMPIRMSNIDDNSVEEYFGWAMEKGASVISCSWGPSARYFPLSLRQKLALKNAATKGRSGLGCVIVFASGNSNRPVNGIVNESGWPNNSLSGDVHWLDGFSSNEYVMSVSACSSEAKKSAYSNWGKEISVCAPSSNSRPDTYPRVLGSLPGWGIITTDRVGPSGYSSADYTGGFGGTSSACPLVAGIAALVISVNPKLTAREVREVLETTADKIIDNSSDLQLGHEWGNYDEEGHSRWFGFGKVNAFKAVTEAVNRRNRSDVEITGFSRPDLRIPDNDDTGVKDVLTFSEEGIVASMTVNIDISHSYIGDLAVTLISPSGTNVLLHNRSGGSNSNLQKTFQFSNAPLLQEFIGESIAGQWELQVKDLANADVGQLNSWGVDIQVNKNVSFTVEEIVSLTIPDNNREGITSIIDVDAHGHIEEIEVFVDITHTYIGDLNVSLQAPSGQQITLHDQQGWEADNIIKTYKLDNTPTLQNLLRENVTGVWQLKVADLAGADVGKLNKWRMKISVS